MQAFYFIRCVCLRFKSERFSSLCADGSAPQIAIQANRDKFLSENMRLIGVNCIEEAGISIVGQDAIIESYDKALKWLVSAYGQAIYEFETGQYETGTEQIEALRGRILDVYTFFSELRG